MASVAGRESSGSMSISTSSISSGIPTRSKAFDPGAGTILTAMTSPVTGLVMLGIACCSAVATTAASANIKDRTRTVGSPMTEEEASRVRMSSSATGMTESGAEMMIVLVFRSAVTVSSRSISRSPPGAYSINLATRISRSMGASDSALACVSRNVRRLVVGTTGPDSSDSITVETLAKISVGPETSSVSLTESTVMEIELAMPCSPPPRWPSSASSRSVFAAASNSRLGSFHVRISVSAMSCVWSSCWTSCSNPAIR